jgi:hypothetical protein
MKLEPLPQALALLVGGFVGGLTATSLVGASPAGPAAAVATGAAPGATVALPTQDGTQSLPNLPSFATGDSDGSMIAVTGVDLTGSSVLYLIDTQNRQLACYQAIGGSSSTQGVKLIGARRIDLDLQLHGFKDRSDYDYRALEREFAELGSDE